MIFLGMTFSGDGTTHKAIQCDARHVHYRAESGPGGATEHVTHFLGVHSALDGTSEQSILAWNATLANIANIYNESPLGKRQGKLLHVVDIFVKLSGMNSDHCAKEKKDAQLLQMQKTSAVFQTLGEDVIMENDNEKLRPELMAARDQMVKDAGGLRKWKELSPNEQADHESKMITDLVKKLGKDSFDQLRDQEKRALSHLFGQAVVVTRISILSEVEMLR